MECHSVNRLLFAKYPLHLLVADIEVGVVVWERPKLDWRERSGVTGFMPGSPLVGECHGGIPFSKDFCNSVHQFGELLHVLWRKILPESRV
jgi:hypothetical protein